MSRQFLEIRHHFILICPYWILPIYPLQNPDISSVCRSLLALMLQEFCLSSLQDFSQCMPPDIFHVFWCTEAIGMLVMRHLGQIFMLISVRHGRWKKGWSCVMSQSVADPLYRTFHIYWYIKISTINNTKKSTQTGNTFIHVNCYRLISSPI